MEPVISFYMALKENRSWDLKGVQEVIDTKGENVALKCDTRS